MDSFEDKIKSLFDEEIRKEPNGFSWEENKDAIYSKMEDEESKRKPIIWWFLSIIALLGSILYLHNSQHLTSPLSKKNDTKLVINQGDVISEDYAIRQEEDIEINRNTTLLSQVKNDTNLSDTKIYGLENKTDVSNNDPNSKIIVKTTYNPSEILTMISLYDGSNGEISETKKTSHKASETIELEEDNTKPLESITKIPKISHSLIKMKKEKLDFDPPYSFDNKTEAQNSTLIKEHSVIIGGGTLLSSGKYKGIENRNKYSTWLPGYHFTMGYNMKINKLSFELSYDYNFAVQKFDFESQDSVSYTQKDVVTHVITNSLTGETKNIINDVTGLTGRNRMYNTYNTFRSHSLGGVINYRIFENHNISLDGGLGARYTFGQKAKGYTLDSNNEVLEYSEINPIYNSKRIDFVGKVRINYRLSKNFSLSPYLKWNQSLSDIDNEANATLKYNQIHLGFETSYLIGKGS